MALIDDNMAVIGNQIRHNAPSNQALHEGDIDDPGRLLLSTMDHADLVRRDIQKRLKPRDPLLKKLPAMDENQGVPSPCSDHICGNNGLSECRGRRKHPGFVLEKSRGGRLLLFRPSVRRETVSQGAVLAGVRPAVWPRCRRPPRSLNRSSRHPRGRATCFENSSAQEMTRGLPKVDRRIACAA